MVKVTIVDTKPAQREKHRCFIFLLPDHVHSESISFKRKAFSTN